MEESALVIWHTYKQQIQQAVYELCLMLCDSRKTSESSLVYFPIAQGGNMGQVKSCDWSPLW